jgi:hypothetical protein
MKIGKYNVRFPFFREQLVSMDADTARGLFSRDSIPTYKPLEITSYFDAYLDEDLIRAMVDDIAESVAGQGYYTNVESLIEKEKKKDELSEGRKSGGQTAKDLIDEFGKHFNLDVLLVNIAKLVLIAGYCPVETQIKPGGVDKCALKIIHPKTIVEIKAENGEIKSITQQVGQNKVVIDGKNLAWFTYGMLGNDVRGTSYVRGCLKLLNTLNKATENVDAILDRYISPVGIWRTRRETSHLKAAVLDREAGEDIFLGNLSEEEMGEKLLEFIQIDPRVPFWDWIIYLDRRLYSYSRANNTWYSLQRSEASSEVIDDIVMRHVASIQRGLKRSVEKFWFEKLAEVYDLSEVPKLEFGKEPTGVEDLMPSDIIVKALELGFLSSGQCFDIMKQMGIKIKEEKAEPSASAKPEQPAEEEPTEEPPEEEAEAKDIEPFKQGTLEIGDAVEPLVKEDDVTQPIRKPPATQPAVPLQQEAKFVCRVCHKIRVPTKANGVYVCPVCYKPVHNEDWLIMAIKPADSKQRFLCRVCLKVLDLWQASDGTFVCPECGGGVHRSDFVLDKSES